MGSPSPLSISVLLPLFTETFALGFKHNIHVHDYLHVQYFVLFRMCYLFTHVGSSRQPTYWFRKWVGSGFPIFILIWKTEKGPPTLSCSASLYPLGALCLLGFLWGWSPGNPKNPNSSSTIYPYIGCSVLTTLYVWYNVAIVRLQFDCLGLATQNPVSSADILAALNRY